MGGQMQGAGNFGFYVDSALERGHSRPNATYASPSLSSEQVFEVDAVEAWLLVPPEEEEEQQRQGKASILTKARRSSWERLAFEDLASESGSHAACPLGRV